MNDPIGCLNTASYPGPGHYDVSSNKKIVTESFYPFNSSVRDVRTHLK